LPGFRQTTTELFWTLNKAANAIIDAFIMSLDLTEKEAENIRGIHTGHDNQLRLLHYPPISREMLDDEKIGRLAAHTDFRWERKSSGYCFEPTKLNVE
jgi:isopenicillin N synthase-like dioxygenase